MNDEDYLPAEEEEPESLKRKWDADDLREQVEGKAWTTCPHCGKPLERSSFFCLYCGEKAMHDSGLLGKMGHWIRNGWLFIVFVIVLLGFIFVMVL